MTRDDLKAMVREVLAEIEAEKATLPPSSWATELLADAKKKGITDGTRPRSTATREEVAIMVRAAVDKNRH